MYKLYHYPLCPFSRTVRLVLNELMVEYVLFEEKFWEYNEKFLIMNNMGTVPVMITEKNIVLNHSQLILEYIYTNHKAEFIFPDENNILEMKKICIWFNEKLFFDCVKFLIQEKLIKSLYEKTQPNANIISSARYNLGIHFEYMTYLLEKNTWIAGERFSIADVVASSYISVLDYFGEIPWHKIPTIKDWYCIVKSRPSFRSLLRDNVVGLLPPKHYQMLDF